jgi:hypothetical protein
MQKNLADIVDAIELGPDDSICQLCNQTVSCPSGLDPTPLCNLCAQSAAEFLPALLSLARMAMIPERDSHDGYDAWHERLLLRARAAVHKTVTV